MKDEIAIGRKAQQQVRQDVPRLRDTTVSRYVTGLGRRGTIRPRTVPTFPPDPSSTSRRTLINVVLALIGGVLLVATVQRVGLTDVQNSLTDIGWWYFAVLALGGLRFAARSRAWQVCTGAARLPFTRAFSGILSADALGNLTPFGMLASEPSKVYFINDRVPTVEAVSSVAAENAFYMTTVLLMIGAGALMFFSVANLPPALKLGAQGVLGLVMIGGLAALWIIRRQPAILSRVARLIARWTGRGMTAPDRLREIEVHFYAVLTWPWSRIAHAAVWEGAFHVAAVTEVFLVLRLLPMGQDVTLLQAFVLETTGRLIVVLFKFVPYRLGVDEAGSAMIAQALALDPTLGVALALVRRLRILFWNAIGLGLLAVRR
ncbi:MAG TPA: lysylphosphatidylglycerol synthase domain-containing protein [Vicinamibacterales bacterium]|nr:lysylphosphatidylglycerol synthase domain-containing protein [Vicinamibacterales bacterium]